MSLHLAESLVSLPLRIFCESLWRIGIWRLSPYTFSSRLPRQRYASGRGLCCGARNDYPRVARFLTCFLSSTLLVRTANLAWRADGGYIAGPKGEADWIPHHKDRKTALRGFRCRMMNRRSENW